MIDFPSFCAGVICGLPMGIAALFVLAVVICASQISRDEEEEIVKEREKYQ